jgi:hypothetical protein
MAGKRTRRDGRSVRISRRGLLRATGAAAAVGSLAGCTGGGGAASNAGTSGSDGGDGGGSGGSDGSGDTVSFATPPVGLPVQLAITHLRENGRIESLFAEDGYTLDVKLTLDDATLFAAGQIDLSTVSWLEAARLGVEQDQRMVCYGDLMSVIQGLHVKAGGPYDPAETGSVQASLDRLVETGDRFGIQSFASGNTPLLKIVLEREYGYTLAQDGGDFTVQTTEYGTMPKLLARGDLAVGVFGGLLAGAGELAAGDVKPLFWIPQSMTGLGLDPGPLMSLTTRRSFAEDHPEVLLNMIQMWDEGVGFIHEDADSLATDESTKEMVRKESTQSVQFLFDHIVKGEYAGQPLLAEPSLGLSEEKVSAITDLMGTLEKLGQVPAGWEDHIDFLTPADIEGMV